MSLLRIMVFGTVLLISVVLAIGYLLGSRAIYEQKKKAEKVKEKKKKEKKLINQDIVSALQSLGFKKQESIVASQKAVEKLGDVEIEKLVKEALRKL